MAFLAVVGEGEGCTMSDPNPKKWRKKFYFNETLMVQQNVTIIKRPENVTWKCKHGDSVNVSIDVQIFNVTAVQTTAKCVCDVAYMHYDSTSAI